jgi:hypothetical protein
MNASSQEREDELKYLDLEEAPRALRGGGPRKRDWAGLIVVGALAWVVISAIALGLRDEWHIILRLFR